MTAALRISELERQTESDIILEDVPEMVRLVASLVAEESSRLPRSFALGSLRDGRLRIVDPIAVTRFEEGNQFVLEAPELNEFGFGENLSEAIADLQSAIAELYLTLEAEQARLGPDLRSVWDVLIRKVRKADAVIRA